MRTLLLTWEFPPLIAGGLGTACYGLAKALLEEGVEIDLVLPTSEKVYFPLRRPEDVDLLPVRGLSSATIDQGLLEVMENPSERLRSLGLSARPETYFTTGFGGNGSLETAEWPFSAQGPEVINVLRESLRGEEPTFRKVRELTARAAEYARRLDFDVIHAHDWLTFPAGMICRQVSRKPLVAHIHATEFDRAVGFGDQRIHGIERAGLHWADRVVAVSRYTAEMIADRYKVPAERLSVVHNGIRCPDRLETKRRRLFKDPLILFLGRMTIQKGPDYFLDVARSVLSSHPRTHFVLAGTGEMIRSLIHRSASFRLKQRLLFTGFLSSREVDRILCAADILIMPSISEPFGLVPLEAMARAVVPIISKQSGVAEILKNAIQVDFWDVEKMSRTICRLIENPDERLRLGRLGREEAEGIRWAEAAQKVKAIYDRPVARAA